MTKRAKKQTKTDTTNISFVKKYDLDTQWTDVLLDFLGYLSDKYGYTIDEYDMLFMPEASTLRRIKTLLNEFPQSETYMAGHLTAIRSLHNRRLFADTVRERARNIARCYMPSQEDINKDDKCR